MWYDQLTITQINQHQKHLLVTDKSTGELHTIPVKLLRDIASGQATADNELIKVMALALINEDDT